MYFGLFFFVCSLLESSFCQVNALLSSLDIDGDIRARGPLPGRFRELEDYWNESQGMMKPGPHAADGWVAEYTQRRVEHGDPNAWAHSFELQHGANGWASEFEHVRSDIRSMGFALAVPYFCSQCLLCDLNLHKIF